MSEKLPRIINVIKSVVSRGTGEDTSLYRWVTQYHDLKGNLLAERDDTVWIKEVPKNKE